jgi:hypothetical protein
MKSRFTLNDPPRTGPCNTLRLARVLAKMSPATEFTLCLVAYVVLGAKGGQRTPDSIDELVAGVLEADKVLVF